MNRSLLCLLLFVSLAISLTACKKMTPDDPLPRHQALKTFDPHRKEFTCRHEADAVPLLDAQAEAWNQEGLYVTRFTLWSDKQDWPKAVELWANAANRKHWKAMMNLAQVYEQGAGQGQYRVEPDSQKALEIVEEAMRLGIAAGYNKMGDFHANAVGVKPDGSRAWAFWEMAADRGNVQALTRIGKALAASYDNPEEGFWGNMPIAIKMLDCAVAQGYGPAAYELGLILNVADSVRDHARALRVLHEGVKFGSEKAANYLFGEFKYGKPMVKGIKDSARAERYSALGDALYHNPDLRFPNLDKVLPLPPAPLPQWDMSDPQKLVDAAKAVVPAAPSRAPSPTSQRTSEVEPIPANLRVAQGIAREAVLPMPLAQWNGAARCPSTGIWQARVADDHPMALVFNQWHRQSYVMEGQPFPDPRDHHLDIDPAQITWTWWNEANHLGFLGVPQVSIGNSASEA